jgi:hypothetical protein
MNKLIVLGPTEGVEAFVAKSKDKFDFKAYLPMPEELERTTYPTPTPDHTKEERQRLVDQYGTANWYDWRMHNWGCKWSPYGDAEWHLPLECDEGESTAEVFFDTAGCPAFAFFENVSKQYPTLCFVLKYAEPGCDFAGHVEYQDGAYEVIAEGNYICRDTLHVLDVLDLWDDVENYFYELAEEITEGEKDTAPMGLEEEFLRWCQERVLVHSDPPKELKENFKELVEQALETY